MTYFTTDFLAVMQNSLLSRLEHQKILKKAICQHYREMTEDPLCFKNPNNYKKNATKKMKNIRTFTGIGHIDPYTLI